MELRQLTDSRTEIMAGMTRGYIDRHACNQDEDGDVWRLCHHPARHGAAEKLGVDYSPAKPGSLSLDNHVLCVSSRRLHEPVYEALTSHL